MGPTALLLVTFSVMCYGQTDQQGPRAEWPCVPGRAVDPSYVEVSESTGGQLFLFQKDEISHAALVMTASDRFPATVIRLVGNLSGVREFEFPVDSTMESVFVLASVQCRSAIRVTRPSGMEMTGSNSAQSIDFKAGRILQVDTPEAGKWTVHLEGSGLFILSVLAKTPIKLAGITFFDDSDHGRKQPLVADVQWAAPQVTGEVSKVKFELTGPMGDRIAEAEAIEPAVPGSYRILLNPPAERFRILFSGIDPSGWPVQRTYPVLFHAERRN